MKGYVTRPTPTLPGLPAAAAARAGRYGSEEESGHESRQLSDTVNLFGLGIEAVYRSVHAPPRQLRDGGRCGPRGRCWHRCHRGTEAHLSA
ncbi:hypothetical protein MES4922_10048 [Mesorhizobium ventifaucium]|uniref:Uncharacterized protein n=1 Tax=Mesorhizobium ventifaucium TaxID=666020 RepID=A0ABN8J9J4_9HYPH|nr:hypothetical protein MES4922_10048 [Mesorhizobium ventifaucium]